MKWIFVFTCVAAVACTTTFGDESPYDATAIDGIVRALETAFDDQLSAKTQAISDLEAWRDGLHKQGTRSRRAVAFTSNPYNLGPIGQCSYPVLDACKFPVDYTVPEVIARQASKLEGQIRSFSQQLLQADGAECERSMMDFLCRRSFTPQCISNTTVRFLSANTQQHCRQAAFSCRTTRSTITQRICNEFGTSDISGDYSLDRCRIPSVQSCSSSRPVPEWIAAKIEHNTRQNPLLQSATTLRLSGSCQNTFLRMSCTLPTCESNGNLQGYRNEATCNTFLSCISDSRTRTVASTSLKCDAIDLLRRPSKCAGQDGRCASSARQLTSGAISYHTVLAASIGIILFLSE